MAKGLKKTQSVKPEDPEQENSAISAPRKRATQGYDPYTGSWDRQALGTGRFIPDTWEGDMPPIKRPGDDDDYDYDENDKE